MKREHNLFYILGNFPKQDFQSCKLNFVNIVNKIYEDFPPSFIIEFVTDISYIKKRMDIQYTKK